MSSLLTSSSKIIFSDNLEDIYKSFVTEALSRINAEYGSILLRHHNKFVRVYANSDLLHVVFPRKNGLTEKAFSSERPIIADAEQSQQQIRDLGIASIILIPLIHKEKPIGVLTMLSKKKKKLTKKELDMLQLFGIVASSAIINAQLSKELKKAVEVRDLFIAMAAHELRTPLTSITVYAQVLKNKLSQKIIPIEMATLLVNEITRFNILVNELLQTNHISEDEFSFTMKPIHLREVIDRAVASAKTLFPTHKFLVTDTLNKNDSIYGDFDKLTQMLINLINNAGKFSQKGSKISISLAKKEKTACISIRDEGKGIEKKDIKKMFTKYYKGDKDYAGLGLGLFLVKKIVEIHHGNIAVNSFIGKGTTVSVCLPYIHE